MLLNINIRDLAVVDCLDLDLYGGMSVLTGETGAGKSILLTAIGLALGDRADSGYIRPNCKRAEITLEFALEDTALAQTWLQENDLGEDKHCLIRRVISQDGRSKAYINNHPVTLQALHELSGLLVEIHGQHAHLTLLNNEQQRQLLDSFAGNLDDLTQLNATYQRWKEVCQEQEHISQILRDKQEREELLRYQLEELQQLDLENFDYAALSEEHSTQAHLEKILTEGQQQLDCLYEHEQGSVSGLLGQASRSLQDLSRFSTELLAISEMLSDAHIQIDEAAQQLRRFLDLQEADPQRLQWLDDQLGIVHNLCRKHQCEAEQLPQIATQIAAELETLSHSSERLEELERHSRDLLDQYNTQATHISAIRQNKGLELAAKISEMIKELGMPHGEFLVNITPPVRNTPTPNGLDRIEFLISANPGLPAKPLNKVASGGELSRISLAIQVTTSSDRSTPTMIFDEVDAGIGGGIAEIVGQKMRQLSHGRQVMCVTHLPQVAAQAHHHLFVAKQGDANSMTSSSVSSLDRAQRIREIARMLGGVQMTENTLAHAEEMLAGGAAN